MKKCMYSKRCSLLPTGKSHLTPAKNYDTVLNIKGNPIMKRLYNEYSAAPSFEGEVKEINDIMSDAFRDVWGKVVANDICPRDAESVCHSVISGMFAEHILRKALAQSSLKLKGENQF